MKRSFPALLLALAMLLSGCGSLPQSSTPPASGGSTIPVQPIVPPTQETPAPSASVPVTIGPSELFSNRDLDNSYEEAGSAVIRLTGSTAECSSNAVQISGSTVTILDEGTYILSGTLDNGMIVVDSEKTDKTQLVLNGVTIHSETSAPIYVLQSDKVFLTTATGTVNTLSNGGAFTAIDDNNIDAAIFSKEDITLNGSGTLVVTSPAGHGIVSKDSLTITGGSYDINCASHAMAGKDDVCIAGGTFAIVSGKDGIHAENADDTSAGFVYIQNGTYDISAQGDGISASGHMQIDGGSFTITTGGGSANAAQKTSDNWGGFMGGGRHQGGNFGGTPGSKPGKPGKPGGDMGGFDNGFAGGFGGTITDTAADTATDSTSIKGIKAATSLIINDGAFTIDSADDAVHSNGCLTVNGGTFDIAAGDDAFHADDTLTITDGTIHISESYEGLEGLHVIVSGGSTTLTAIDDGINAAGGTDASGFTGGRDGMFGGGMGRPGMGGGASNGSITISGGTLHVTAHGDGIDANGTLDITGGHTTVCGPTQGDTATLDYDSRATISGGTFIGTGASGMAQSFSSSPQGVIAVSVGQQSAGTEITLKDKSGSVVLTHTPDLNFAVVILSAPQIIAGDTYTITVGSASGDVTAG
ncbi:MAG: carbohydrate-binding domain-containing protein [Ruminococcaceae bacterium]|nr:carbohydrate-binding domain-containing protein [Oscillospiraceae bacterium]